jgi:hypothetical protein
MSGRGARSPDWVVTTRPLTYRRHLGQAIKRITKALWQREIGEY